MSETFEMVAKTLYGLEEILAEELLALGANDLQIGRRMVSFTGDKEFPLPYCPAHSETDLSFQGQRC